VIKGFVNGDIYVSFKPLRKVKAFAVENGKVIYVGRNEDVVDLVKKVSGDIVDLGGRTVLPGFIDSHAHIDELGIFLNAVDLRGVRSIAELKERIRRSLDRVETLWVLGHGWDQELFEEKRWPTRWDIDDVVSHRPALLTRICLHVGLLNTLGLRVTGLENVENPNIVRNDRGIATGIVREDMLEVVWEKVRDSISVEQYEKLLLNTMRFAVANGVTTIGFTGCDLKVFKALINLWSRGMLITRVRVYLYPGREWEVVEILERLGLRRGFGDNFFKLMGVKVIADGTLGARTAWLSEPYSDNPSTSGAPSIPPEDLKNLVKKVHSLGLQLAIHGIGDRAIDTILSIYSELRDVASARHRIEHASVLREDQVELIAKLGVAVSVQPNFIISDWWAMSRLGKKRVRWLYPFKTLIEKNIAIGFGTDSPVEPINPWQTIYAAITRGRYEGIAHYEDTKDQCLDIIDALHSYTYGSAYIMFEEQNLGTLEVGKLADFIVVDRDPLKVDGKNLRNVKVLETYVGGVKVYP
jgi:predicted amidohydrolase YtcJ